ncbi:MAG: TetR-like C-terminal domain-containing protein [Bacillota bacterium]|nr:TetR-like C-terminal domain-containing protein [Bacillota bacterium]
MFDYYAGGLYKTSVKWIQNGMKESDEEMAELICRLSDFIEIL